MRLALIALALAIATFSTGHAEVRRIVIDRQERVVDHQHPGIAAYVKLRGRLIGEVDPRRPENAIIQDIELAPRNHAGRVQYVATFTLLRPEDAADSNRVLLTELPNRGHRLTPFGSDSEALKFLRAYGYSVLWVGWQGDLPERPDAMVSAESLELESLNAPRAVRRNGAPLTGAYLIRVPTLGGSGPSGQFMKLDQGRAGAMVYFPATYDSRDAKLTGGAVEEADGKPLGRRYVIPPSDWAWWNCAADATPTTARSAADLCVKRLRGDFQPDESYTLILKARDPIVLGIGMASTRDAVSFFRNAAADSTGTPNPLTGSVDYVIGQGVSQVGNLVKTFIALGFNADEQGRRVWDGASTDAAGRRAPVNYRFATPGSSATLYMPGSEGVLSWASAPGTGHGHTRSLLDRCGRTDSCPMIFETFGGAELWSQRMSAGLVTPDLKHDIPLPKNVRRYFFPGTSHGGGQGGFGLDSVVASERGACTLPLNPNSQKEQMRALLVALTQWVTGTAMPPASHYPTISAVGLVRDTPQALHVPRWHEVVKPYGISNPLLVYDYGPTFDHSEVSGVISRMPPRILGIVPALVPQMDSDGNELGGVPSVQMMAPLGSYLSWNVYREGLYGNRLCSFNGGFVPFAKTRAERIASGDERLSLEERYGTDRGYVSAVRKAVDKAVNERFLLREDAALLMALAEEAMVYGDLKFLTKADTWARAVSPQGTSGPEGLE